ncbi:hypothetical protein ACO0QE_003502 [Hanseniaspora vineae]
MRLKITIGSGSKVVSIPNEKAPSVTLNDLVNEYINFDQDFKEQNVTSQKQLEKIRFGYPIRTVDINDDPESYLSTLDSLGIGNGERIVITTKLDANPLLTQGTSSDNTSRKKKKSDIEYSGLTIEDIPDDNSCLFHSISYCLFKPTNYNERMEYSNDLRKICAEYILSHQSQYNTVVLEKSPVEYSRWIMKKDVWGGAIEISILSKFYKIAIYVLDISFDSFEKFNEDQYEDFIILFYNGSHYDVCQKKIDKEVKKDELPTGKDPIDAFQTIFNKSNDYETQVLLTQCLELSKKLKQAGFRYEGQRR